MTRQPTDASVASALPVWARAEATRQAEALARFQWVAPAGAPVGPLLSEALALMKPQADACLEPDPARSPIIAPFARLKLLVDAAATKRLLAVPEAMLAPVRAGRGLVVFDCATEGRAHTPRYAANMHAALASVGIAPERAAWVQQNRLLAQHYRAECAARGVAPMHIVVAHAHASGLWRRVMLGARGSTWRFGFAVGHDGPRPYRWVCLNYNLRAHRALLVTWLRARSEPGYLSFSVTREDYAPDRIARVLASAAALGGADPRGARAAVAGLIRSRLHVASDIDAIHPRERVYGLPFDAVAGAELFIVTETEMDGPGLLRWTEKTLKALASGLPFIVFGNAGVVAALAAMGFDTLGDLVDHGYDAEPDPACRFAAARTAVARFLARPPGFTAAEMDRLRAAAAHNRAVFAEALLRDALIAPMDQILALAAA